MEKQILICCVEYTLKSDLFDETVAEQDFVELHCFCNLEYWWDKMAAMVSRQNLLNHPTNFFGGMA